MHGWDWVLYYPSYFLRGFAVHGYVDVPTYPASHGCVRIPIWVVAADLRPDPLRLADRHPLLDSPAVSAHADDQTLAGLRAQIEEADREILAAFLHRLDVARQVRRHKEEHGYAFVDAGREQELLDRWIARRGRRAARRDGARSSSQTVLALSKREAAR